jgi:uncharacterized RDD family membrane protein YckC
VNQPRERVRFPLRLAAAALDYAAIGAVSAIVGLLATGAWWRGAVDPSEQADAWLNDPVLAAAVGVLAAFGVVGSLYMLLEVVFVATPGKRLVGIVVACDDGASPPVARRVARYLVKNGHLVVAALSAVSGMWIAGMLAPLVTLVVIAGSALMLTDDRRALHDIVAGTAVFRRR